jgi:hypothetical protein
MNSTLYNDKRKCFCEAQKRNYVFLHKEMYKDAL